ncbi:uncharacterized protein LOC124292391 isoform X2 [Haliotis rubra]|uniref:uncharacterized protein LOC124292391 isoform X2 n=1 Tax=Haliotis rubra TaxID=36100 RepID=UPI001EE5E21D|nr:uncharacterized protein LOC124292391 isoform X2 [Haliotis rubra]
MEGVVATKEESAPIRHHSVNMPDDDDKMSGILDYNLCPGHTRLASYMIAQGATSVVIPILASCWYCCKCISGNFIGAICVIIGLFNIAWGIVGSCGSPSSPCNDTLLFTHALGFSVPMWIFFCLLCVWCVRARCKCDD